MAEKRQSIFSGDYSESMWRMINGAKRKRDFRMALYVVCCRLQELEHELEQTRALRPNSASDSRGGSLEARARRLTKEAK